MPSDFSYRLHTPYFLKWNLQQPESFLSIQNKNKLASSDKNFFAIHTKSTLILKIIHLWNVLCRGQNNSWKKREISPGKPASEHTSCLFMGSKANILGRGKCWLSRCIAVVGTVSRQWSVSYSYLISTVSLCTRLYKLSKATLKYQFKKKTEFLTQAKLDLLQK